MTKHIFHPRLVVLLLIIAVVGALRIPDSMQVTPWSGFSPVGAMAIFGGAYFTSKWKAFLFPLITLLIGDFLVSIFVHDGKYGIIYDGWYWIYAIYLLIVMAGRLLIKKVTIKNIVLASVLAAILHWLLSDLTMWIMGATDLRTMQPLSRDINGLIQCYIQGFPFMLNFLVGTLVYSGIMFGVFEWVKKNNPALQVSASAVNQQ
jgi:hypothetical protein